MTKKRGQSAIQNAVSSLPRIHSRDARMPCSSAGSSSLCSAQSASSRRIAVSGMMVALGAAVMLLGGVIPIATFCCPAIAGLALIPLVFDCGRAYALSAYGAIALLSLMLCPDKEAALLFCFLGYYPVVKWVFDARIKRKWPRRLTKLLLWNAAIGIMYALIFFVFRLDQIMADYMDMTLWMTALTLLLGNVTLALYDIVLLRFSMLYLARFRNKLFKS